jgi:hypothetical protein
VATFRLEEKGLRQIGTLNGSVRFHGILKSGDGGVLLAGVQQGREKGAVLLNAELEMPRWIPQSPGFSVLGEKMPEGRGLLLANAKGLAAFLDQQTVRIERSDGQVLGSFQVPSAKGRSSPTVIFLDEDRILFDPAGNPEVRKFDGTILKVLKKPGSALGWRIRQSEDGNYVLYDSFVRSVGLWQGIAEKALVLPTMGMSADGQVPNGEVVRVIDTRSGNTCFDWREKENLLPPFVDHADIAPSGRMVAAVTQRTLNVFALTEGCVVN